ncbi:MAG: hypothetical protein LBM75_04775 [Myxococcales bacterium]|jgi:hypothetical protein|nr:hypothetical protein [Myxococcales bacterium]
MRDDPISDDPTLGTYLKAAFLNPWNLLLFAALAVTGIILNPVVLLPIVFALETAYLGFIGTSPRFQRAIKSGSQPKSLSSGSDASLSRKELEAKQRTRFEELYNGLDPRLKRQFDELRKRCDAFNALGTESSLVAKEQLAGINKLLWVYLKLLHTKMTLDRFFENLNTEEMDRTERDALRRLGDIKSDALDPISDKKRKSIEDTITTVRARRENIKRALDNREFVLLEIDRIGVKLTGISEMAINRHDASNITQDVDSVANSVEATEQAIGELNLFTGFTAIDDVAPDILSDRRLKVR